MARIVGYAGLGWRSIKYSAFANAVRIEMARAAGARIGRNVRMRPGVLLKGFRNISIGNDCYIGENTKIIGYSGHISIGNNVIIAEDVYISARNHRFRDARMTIREQGYKGADVIIEDDVWLAHGAVVLAGTRLRSRTVVGAGTVAHKDMPGERIHLQKAEVVPMNDGSTADD